MRLKGQGIMNNKLFWAILLQLVLSFQAAHAEDCPFVPGQFPSIERLYKDLVDAKVVLQEVKVAIIDSGVDVKHKALKRKVSGGISFIPSKDFQGAGSVVQNIRALKNSPQRSPEQENQLQSMYAELQKKQTR